MAVLEGSVCYTFHQCPLSSATVMPDRLWRLGHTQAYPQGGSSFSQMLTRRCVLCHSTCHWPTYLLVEIAGLLLTYPLLSTPLPSGEALPRRTLPPHMSDPSPDVVSRSISTTLSAEPGQRALPRYAHMNNTLSAFLLACPAVPVLDRAMGKLLYSWTFHATIPSSTYPGH